MKKILIVDDDADLRELMKISLEMTGYIVLTADTCAEGIKTFYHEMPDIVLLDIDIHNDDGRGVCREIKANTIYRQIPVIMLSGNLVALETFRACGASDRMAKPFDLKLLEEKIKYYLAA